jgi:immune inhibitor A
MADEPLATVVNRISGGLTTYFVEVSRGLLDLEVVLLAEDWVTAREPHAFYGGDGGGVDDRNQPIYELAREVLIAVDSVADFRFLDQDSDGVLEMGEAHILIIQSGDDQASTGVGDDIWSHRWWIYGEAGGGDTILDGVRLSEPGESGDEVTAGYVMAASSDPQGVIIHELLHSFGAPDLYDVSGSSAVPVGPWSVMDIGLWLGSPSGTQPCRPGGYLEWDIDAEPANGLAGWVTPLARDDGEHMIPALGTGDSDVQLIPTSFSTEYFLLENRAHEGLDAALPEAGILVYHIDTAEPVNNEESTPPYRVWLEDPGQRMLKRGAAYSEDDGPGQTAFTPATTPSSDTNRGEETGIAITAVGPEGSVMSYELSGTTPVAQVDRLVAWPAPVRAGGTLRVVLPEGTPLVGRLELVDLFGRRVASRDLDGGSVQPLFSLPPCPHGGALILIYRAGASTHAASVIVVP